MKKHGNSANGFQNGNQIILIETQMENQKSVPQTWQQPSQKNLPDLQTAADQIIKMIDKGILTLTVAIKGQQISAYSRENGKQAVGVVLCTWIGDLASSLNVNNNLDAKQVANIAMRLLKHYWQLKLAEIALFIDQAKAGQFGKSYNRLDEGVFFEWLDKYCEERNLFCENQQNKIPKIEDMEISQWDKRLLDVMKQIGEEHSHNTGSLREKLTDPEFKERYKNEFLTEKTEAAE